jgi:hypothetical protein
MYLKDLPRTSAAMSGARAAEMKGKCGVAAVEYPRIPTNSNLLPGLSKKKRNAA